MSGAGGAAFSALPPACSVHAWSNTSGALRNLAEDSAEPRIIGPHACTPFSVHAKLVARAVPSAPSKRFSEIRLTMWRYDTKMTKDNCTAKPSAMVGAARLCSIAWATGSDITFLSETLETCFPLSAMKAAMMDGSAMS